MKMNDANQLSVMSAEYPAFSKIVKASTLRPRLVRVSRTDVVERTLEEFIEEIQSRDRRLR
jgi:hypothetical protein